MAARVDYSRRQNILLRVRVDDANLASDEAGMRLAAWSSVWRTDPGPKAQVRIPLPLDANRSSGEHTLALVVPQEHGSADSPWPADATLWIGARIYAPSEEGPLVGGRAGCAGVHFQDLRERLALALEDENDDPILLKLRMSQPGVPGKDRYHKMSVRILGFVNDKVRNAVRAWTCSRTIGQFDYVKAKMPRHDDLLNEYVNVSLFPYTDVAKRQDVFFRPSHHAVEPIHAPMWLDNVAVPGFAFWMQTGVPRYDDAMTEFMKTAAATVLERHDWPHGIPGAVSVPGAPGVPSTSLGRPPPSRATQAANAFVGVVNTQFRHTSSTDTHYNDTFTYAVAALMDTCSLLAVSTFYRFDEMWRVDQHWFREPSVKKAQIESFQDALAMAGGDCEDVGSLTHRVFRWLQLGDPNLADHSRYWTTFGGWRDPVLDAMQRIAYWYVSGGTLGSVTAARFHPQPGGVPQLLIRSDEDEHLPVGGHMWQEAIPVVKFETLVRRMNQSGMSRDNTVRPDHPGRYPGWIKFLPHTIGEGTGSVYPLVLPLTQYMHSDAGRAAAMTKHTNMIGALKRLQHKTSVLGRMQVERWSDRTKSVPDARVNYFYRRATKFSTDDLALRYIPRFDFIWARRHRRETEKQRRQSHRVKKQQSLQQQRQFFDEDSSDPDADIDGDALVGTRTDEFVNAIPGEGTINGSQPEWGVDMRDRVMTANLAVEGGKIHPEVALVTAPSVTREEMASFQSRIAQLAPWRQPWRTADKERKVTELFAGAIAEFQETAEGIITEQLARTGPPSDTTTRVNVIFRRRQFLMPNMLTTIYQDLGRLDGDVARVETALEFLENDIYSVRVSLWMFDGGVIPEEDVVRPAP